MYTAILMSDAGFELCNFPVDHDHPIKYGILIPSSEFEGNRHPSRPETMVRTDVIFYVDQVETELAQMLYGDHVLVFYARDPNSIYIDSQSEQPF
jgi:hypothetical protein